MDYVKYDYGYMFKYSERPNTTAEKKLTDNIPENIKQRRLTEIINKQSQHSLENMQKKVGKIYEVLIERASKKSKEYFFGRTTHNSSVVFENGDAKIGDYVMVKVENCTSATLFGKIISYEHTTS